MATYNSAQNGNWNTDATWTEAGHPNANDDITIITHDVTYDVGVSAVTWGNCTINSPGVLIFPIAANSKMLFNATGILTINSGGELRIGTSGSPIGASYLCQLHWPQGASVRNALVLNDGGKIDVYGDPAYYGSAKTAILDSQWAVGSGLTLYVEGDYSAKWVAGQHFIIHDFAVYSNYASDAESFEIASVGAYDVGNDRTPIIVTAAGDSDTFVVGAKLWMLDRNVELLDPGSGWAVGGYAAYTERLRFDNNQDIVRGAVSSVNINETLFRGWDSAVYGGDGFTGDGDVFLNCNNGFRGDIYSIVTDNLIASCNSGFYTPSAYMNMSGNIVACNAGLDWNSTLKFIGDIIGCNYGVSSGADNAYIIGNIYSCSRGINQSTGVVMRGNIEKCLTGTQTMADVLLIGDIKDCSSYGHLSPKNISHIGSITGCGIGIQAPSGIVKVKNGTLNNTTDVAGINSLVDTLKTVIFEDYIIGAVKKELQSYSIAGDILCLHNGDGNWQAPPSGENFILQVVPNSLCNILKQEWLSLSSDPLNMMFTYVGSTGAKTLTFKIYPVGWSSSIDNEDIVLEVFYLAGAGVTRTRVVNTTATYTNGGWRNLSVSFTVGQVGIVYFVIHLKKYEAGDYVLIDPEWSIS